MIELYDVGRVLVRPFEDGYKFIAEQGHRYITNSASLYRIIAFHKDRTRKLTQEDFNNLNNAWVKAILAKELDVNPTELVYGDVAERLAIVRAIGDMVYLHTSGSKKLVDLLIGNQFQYNGILVGENEGDKNVPATFREIWKTLNGDVRSFYDDKPCVLFAAYEGFREAGGSPELYLVDRFEIVAPDTIAQLEAIGIMKITRLDEIADIVNKGKTQASDAGSQAGTFLI